MNRLKRTGQLKRLAVIVGLSGAIALDSFSAAFAQRFYPYYRFFNRGASYESQDNPTLVEGLSKNRNLKTFTAVLQKANLIPLLSGNNQLTILAPTEEAFAALPPGMLEKLLRPENRELLQKIVRYHVIPGEISESDLLSGELKTLDGTTVKVSPSSSATQLILNDATARELPLLAKNGVIVRIDRVLLPPGLIPLGATSSSPPIDPEETVVTLPAPVQRTSFICASGANGLPTTYAVTTRGKVPVIRWFSDYFSSGGFTPEKRCQEVSARFQNFYNSGQLNFITSGYVNGQAVVCAVQASGRPCSGANVLFTLKPGSNAGETVQRLFNIRAGASGPLYESQDEPSAVYIDFKQFLNSTVVEGVGAAASPDAPAPNASPAGGLVW
ncbi:MULTISPECIES: COP23 domain-containing protein [unclassified Microcoleus]|uniref:COP23 domain-containing protein n=1 Tax=unclassified Microcoleus TaxID=2642155 RepID=UPI002FD755E6